MKLSRLLSQKRFVSHQVVPYPKPQNQQNNIQQIRHQVWHNLVNYLTRPPEPRVQKKCNHRGKIWWKVYDPYTNRSAEFSSEAEVRMWLDQRHYQ